MQLLADRVLVRPDPKRHEEILPSGLIRPIMEDERYRKGTVVQCGHHELSDGTKVPFLDLKEGDRIMHGKFTGTEVRENGETLLVMRYVDCICVLTGTGRIDLTAISNCDPSRVPDPT